MNMISTGAFLSEMDASIKQTTLAEKFAAVWEKKNAKAARAGGVSLMALSLAACGSDDEETETGAGGTTDAGTGDTTTVSAGPDPLTYDTDTISGEGTFNAGLVWSPGGDTRVESLQSDDNITGTGTADVINVTSDGGTIAPTFTGLETVNYSLQGTTAGTLNLSAATGLEAVSLASTAADATISGLTKDVTATVKNYSDASVDAVLVYKASSLTGSADTVSIAIDNFNGANINLGIGATAAAAGTGVETLKITTSGEASTVASLGSGATSFDVDAGSNLTLTAVTATGITSFNASDSTGNVSVNVASNVSANNFDYDGGAGDDTVIMNSAFTGTDNFNGGAGSDTMSIRGTADIAAVGALDSSSAAVVSNVETLDMRSNDNGGAGAADYTVDMDHMGTGATAVTMRVADTNSKAVFTLNDLSVAQSGALTVTHTGTDANTDSEVIVDMKVNGADDTINLTATVSADTQVVELNDANNDIENATITLAGAFTSNVDVDVSSFLTNLTISGGASGKSVTLANNVANSTFDAHALVGNLASFTTTGTTQTIKGGSGNDILVLNAGVKTVDMGAGNDSVTTSVAMLGTAATSWDTIAAGAGTDTLIVSTMAAITAEAATGLSGFERLKIDASADPGANVTVNLANFVNNDDFARITIGDTHDDVLIIDSVGSAFTDLRFDADAESDTEATLNRLVDTSSNSMKVTITGSETIKTLNLNDEESVTITSSDANAATITTLSATDATSITATGGGNVIITNAITGTKIATVDVQDLAAAATINAGNSASNITATGNALNGGVFTFTGGSGNDTITGGIAADVLTGGSGVDTIVGGAAGDTITGGDGADTLTGGTGVDTFMYSTLSTANLDGDTITDFTKGTGGDEIELNTAGGATVALVETATNAQAAGAADDGDVFVITGSTVINTSGDATADLAALNDAVMDSGSDAADANAECLVVINADSDGDGTADAIQVWWLHETSGANSTFDAAGYVATLNGIAANTDLAGDFVAANFDFS